MIPLSLVTGFLGSGKTTLLQCVIERNDRLGLAYIVNECAEVDLDGRLLELGEDQLVCIPGGSVFCRCLSWEFVRVLRELPGRFADRGLPLEGVIIEASGIADPKVIATMLEENRIDRIYELRRIVSVIDPASFVKLIVTLPSVVSQVEACDVALVNKADLHGEDALRRVEQEIERINPQARIVRSTYCRAEIDVLAGPARGSLEGRYAVCRDPNYLSAAVAVKRPIDPGPLLAELRRIEDHVYRIKGFVPVPDGRVYVDVAGGRLSSREVPLPADRKDRMTQSEPGRLVFIYPPQAEELVDGVVAGLKGAV